MHDTTTRRIFEVHLPVPELSKGDREYRAFKRLLPSLLHTHRGLHVAIHDGQAVGFDTDDIALILRVKAKVGNVPIYVGRVTETQPIHRFTRYREIRTETKE